MNHSTVTLNTAYTPLPMIFMSYLQTMIDDQVLRVFMTFLACFVWNTMTRFCPDLLKILIRSYMKR